MKKTFLPLPNSICSLSYLGCNQSPKYNYPTCSKICGDLKLILDHPGSVPVIVLGNGSCGLKQFGCSNPTYKNLKTGEYYTGCCLRHSEMIKRIMMTGQYVIIDNDKILEPHKKLENSIKKSYSSCWMEAYRQKEPRIFIGCNY